MIFSKKRSRRNKQTALALSWLICLAVIASTACSDDATTSSGSSGRDNQSVDTDAGDAGIESPDSGTTATDAADDASMLCDPNPCGTNTRCDVVAGEATCIPLSCEELNCGETEQCEAMMDGTNACVDNSCNNDGDCDEAFWCDGICLPDACESNQQRCQDNALVICAPNGSGERNIPCGSEESAYASVCIETGEDTAACSCEGDWDCPVFMTCEVGICQGTGEAPQCALTPEPFDQVPPSLEISWGGTFDNREPEDIPFGRSSQAVISPVVANLTDDNGDGLVNELDFPEILFLTFCGSSYVNDGVLRAVHGGGASKGEDLFVAFGDQLWRQGEPFPEDPQCGEGDLDPTGGMAVGDLDDPAGPLLELGGVRRRELPEIVTVGQNNSIIIYNNEGKKVATSPTLSGVGPNPAPAIANMDNQGMAEIIIANKVLKLTRLEDGGIDFDVFTGDGRLSVNSQGAISCVGDLLPDQRGLELVSGSTVWSLPTPPEGINRPSECTGSEEAPEEVAYCDGELVERWSAREVNNNINGEGFCAIADVLGADQQSPPGPDNKLDGVPELLIIQGGLFIFNNVSGELVQELNAAGSRGGAPNVDDFDGDGFPEIGTAFERSYVTFDLQAPSAACPAWERSQRDDEPREEANALRAPGGDCVSDTDCAAGAVCNTKVGQCVCLHNSWLRTTEDDSSRVTGSTLFDFNGDSASEVIYNDECWFRIYDGATGEVLFKEPSESRTRIEYPIVADVDNDGNAEIIFAVSNESGFCSEGGRDAELRGQYNNGLEVWGDPTDNWVSARRIWNQHSYHVTNVLEDGRIPAREPPGWKDLNGRSYNSYRSQPRSTGVAPDLTPIALQFVSPGEGCGTVSDELEILVRVQNIGDLRVGPGVIVTFYGIWDGGEPIALKNDQDQPITRTITDSLAPGFLSRLAVSYNATENGDNPDRIPQQIQIRVDEDGTEDGAERECREDNNTITRDVQSAGQLADLAVTSVTSELADCFSVPLSATVTNLGTANADDVLVRFYAGDPEQGGEPLGETFIDGTLAPGEQREVSVDITNFPYGLSVIIHAFADPENRIEECNDSNNSGESEDEASCFIN